MKPYTSKIILPGGTMEPTINHYVRKLSDMRGMFLDEEVRKKMEIDSESVLYEVYEQKNPEETGELQFGTSIVHPGKVGDEYFMTKGHFHQVLDTSETYYCLEGNGYMMMEDKEGNWCAEELKPGVVLYVPPGWAHRSINVDSSVLVTYFVYPGHAGHDYGTIESLGFRKLVIEKEGKAQIIDNPRWKKK